MPLSSCLHPPVANSSLWTSERKFCSWNRFGFSQSPPRWCQAASGRGEQPPAQLPAGHGLTTNALSILRGSPRPPSDLHIPFLGASRGSFSPCPAPCAAQAPQCVFRMPHMPHCAFRCSLGAPVCIPGHTIFLLVPFRPPQESPFAFWWSPGASLCLSVCPYFLLGPLDPLTAFSDPSSLSAFFCALGTPWLGVSCTQMPCLTSVSWQALFSF